MRIVKPWKRRSPKGDATERRLETSMGFEVSHNCIPATKYALFRTLKLDIQNNIHRSRYKSEWMMIKRGLHGKIVHGQYQGKAQEKRQNMSNPNPHSYNLLRTCTEL